MHLRVGFAIWDPHISVWVKFLELLVLTSSLGFLSITPEVSVVRTSEP